MATLSRRCRQLLHSRLSPLQARLLGVLAAGTPIDLSAPQLKFMIRILAAALRGRLLANHPRRDEPFAYFSVGPSGQRWDPRRKDPDLTCVQVCVEVHGIPESDDSLSKEEAEFLAAVLPPTRMHFSCTVQDPSGFRIGIYGECYHENGPHGDRAPPMCDDGAKWGLQMVFLNSEDTEWVAALLLASCLRNMSRQGTARPSGEEPAGGWRACRPTRLPGVFECAPTHVWLQMYLRGFRRGLAIAQLLESALQHAGGSSRPIFCAYA